MPQQQQAQVNRGVIRWYNETKGYGFVEPDDKSGDIFAHRSAVAASGITDLAAGDHVEVEWLKVPRGKQATRIRLLTTAACPAMN
jgi:cold shock protein